MASFFGRGGGSNNSNNHHQSNTGGAESGGYGRDDQNLGRGQSGFSSGGGSAMPGGYGQEQHSYGRNQPLEQGTDRYDDGATGTGTSYAAATTNTGPRSTAGTEGSGYSAGTGSQFGSINNEDMDRASISTFGNATSVADSDHFGSSTQGQKSSGGQGYETPNTNTYGGQATQPQQLGSQTGSQMQGSTGQQQSSASFTGLQQGSGPTRSDSEAPTDLEDETPMAIAADFKSDTANIIFISSESGQGANKQPATKFRIHEVNLNVHSAILSEMVDDEDDDENDNIEGDERTPVILEEDAATLKLLFGLMYNRPSPPLSMSDWQVVLRVARAAQKYNCARAKEIAAAYFTEQEQLGALSPFMTYAFATQYKLEALEEAAAERSVRYDLHRLPELVLGMMGFAAYQKLSAFHARRQSFYSDVLGNISIDPKELADQCYQTGGVCAVGPWNKIKQRLQWPRQAGRDGSKKPPEASTVLRALVLEVSSLDCGSCSRALAESCLTVQTALNSLPGYREDDEASF